MKKVIALLLSLSLVLGIGAASADSWLDWLFGDDKGEAVAASVEAAVEDAVEGAAADVDQAIADAVATAELAATDADTADAEPAAPAGTPAEDMSAGAAAFKAMLDEQGFYYTYAGKMNDGSDHFYMSFGNESRSYYVDIYFLTDGTHGELRIWNLIDYNASSYYDVVTAVDSLNGNYKYATFQTDGEDNSITVSMDLIYGSTATADQVADITFEALVRIVQITRDAYATLEPFKK